MKTIKFNTKRGQSIMKSYWKATARKLSDCYEKWSWHKQLAYDYCMGKKDEEHGWNLRIISYNTMQFTVAWMTDYGLRVETRDNSYIITDLPF